MKSITYDENHQLYISVPYQIMLLCDDSETGFIWSNILRNKGLQTVLYDSADIALKRILESPGSDHMHNGDDVFDLIIIDESTNQLNSIQFIKSVRANTGTMAILLTPNPREPYILEAYRSGADDCMVKPVSPGLFLARVQSSLRRARTVPIEPVGSLQIAGMRLDPINRLIIDKSGKVIRLTQLEYRLMYLMITRPGQVIKPDEMIAHVWGQVAYGDAQLLKHLIFRLRRKIESDPRMPVYIKTEPGLGYRFSVE